LVWDTPVLSITDYIAENVQNHPIMDLANEPPAIFDTAGIEGSKRANCFIERDLFVIGEVRNSVV
jgi:hypothetical protein